MLISVKSPWTVISETASESLSVYERHTEFVALDQVKKAAN